MQQKWQQFLLLITSIIVMSSSGVLGTYISLPPPVTIWLRCLLGALLLYIIVIIRKIDIQISAGNDFRVTIASAALLGLHWVSYFYALSITSIAVSMLSMFTYPVITAILEPLIQKREINLLDMLLACIALLGVFFLIPEFNLKDKNTYGVGIGVISAFFYALRNILASRYQQKYSGITLMYKQLYWIAILFAPLLFLQDIPKILVTLAKQWQAVLILSVFTTALAHTLFLQSLQNFRITTASIISTLTPVFGILLGYIFLDQIPQSSAYIGGTIILTIAIVESIRVLKR
ncbi:MAG: DMT family transporter [Spirochaetota bacterium]